MVKRNKRFVFVNNNSNCNQVMNRAPLLLTNGSSGGAVFASSRINSFSSPFVHDDEDDDQKMEDGDCDEYWSSAVEEIRWDTMFHNLKPT